MLCIYDLVGLATTAGLSHLLVFALNKKTKRNFGFLGLFVFVLRQRKILKLQRFCIAVKKFLDA
jgi:hypothetical protein